MQGSLRRLAWLVGAVALALTTVPEVRAGPLLQAPASAPQTQQPPERPKPPAAPAETTEARPAPTDKLAQPPARPTFPGVEPEQVFFELKYGINLTELQGETDRSFLHEGVNHLFDFSYYVNREVVGFRRFESLSVFRYTDNPRVDPERNSLQRSYSRFLGPTFEFTLGDHLVSYSRFTFNQNIKGLNLRKDLGSFRLTSTAGVFTDRWGALFRDYTAFRDPRREPDERFPAKPYTRMVLGLRGERKFRETLSLAFNYSQGSDIKRTLPRKAEIPPIDNQLLGFDTSLVFGRNFRLAAEAVYSLTSFDSRIQPDKRGDYAARLELSHRWSRLSWRAEYTLFRPNFFSANSRQVQDLQDGALRATLDLTKFLSLQVAHRRTSDNLPGTPVLALAPDSPPPTCQLQLCALTHPNRTLSSGGILQVFDHIVDAEGNKMTTVAQLPEARLSLRQLPRLARLQVDFGYRERQVQTSNKGSFDATSGTPLFRHRITKMPFAELTLPDRSGVFTFSYEYRDNRDLVSSKSTFTHRLAPAYNGTWYFGNWQVLPRVRYEIERTSEEGLADLTRSQQASLELGFPKYFTLEAAYRALGAKLVSGGYHRPSYRAQLTYRIRNDENRFITFIVERNLNSFAQLGQDFREDVAQISVVWRFRRQ